MSVWTCVDARVWGARLRGAVAIRLGPDEEKTIGGDIHRCLPTIFTGVHLPYTREFIRDKHLRVGHAECILVYMSE